MEIDYDFDGSLRLADVLEDFFFSRSTGLYVFRHPPTVDREALFALVRTAFGQRRKMLRRSLAGRLDPAVFATAGVSPEARPEQLSIDDWVRLTDASAS